MAPRRRLAPWLASVLLVAVAACGTDSTSPPDLASARAGGFQRDTLAALVRRLTAGRGITALPPAPHVRPALVRLGQALAFDKILSGNHDISCMSCHLPQFATGDGLSLSIGQGGVGLGPNRTGSFIARNAPAAFNLTAIKPLFLDGRVEQDAAGNYHTPAGADLTPAMTQVFEFGSLSAQPLFPILSRAEMRGDAGNELAAFPDADNTGIWNAIMARLGAIPEYRRMFEAAYPGTRFDDMNIAYASNAIAGFLAADFAFANSPWDQFLRGSNGALSEQELLGARDFMTAKCSVCHNGAAFTDNKFHNVAVAQIGPGEGDGAGGTDDFGRMRVTGLAADQYAFRTPALRNVELTGPYGHDGAYVGLRMFVDHYSESDTKLRNFDPGGLSPLLQGTLQTNAEEILATRDTLLNGVVFDAKTVDEVTDFMKALTDPAARDLSRTVPRSVPSGLPID